MTYSTQYLASKTLVQLISWNRKKYDDNDKYGTDLPLATRAKRRHAAVRRLCASGYCLRTHFVTCCVQRLGNHFDLYLDLSRRVPVSFCGDGRQRRPLVVCGRDDTVN